MILQTGSAQAVEISGDYYPAVENMDSAVVKLSNRWLVILVASDSAGLVRPR